MSFERACRGRRRKLRVVMLVLAVVCWTNRADAQPAQRDRPLAVRVTGTGASCGRGRIDAAGALLWPC
jgi:hypothetical protein